MKRKALLAITGCTAKAFETYSSRGFLPFGIDDRNWSDYSLQNAFQLRVLMDAALGTDLDSAAFLARSALDRMYPLNPFSYTGDQHMWTALVRYDWSEAPADWDCRMVVSGRWQDLQKESRDFLTELCPGSSITSIQAISATKIAHEVWHEASDFGLPEAEHAHPIPEDLKGYPEWFKEAEMTRRRVVFGVGESDEV